MIQQNYRPDTCDYTAVLNLVELEEDDFISCKGSDTCEHIYD